MKLPKAPPSHQAHREEGIGMLLTEELELGRQARVQKGLAFRV